MCISASGFFFVCEVDFFYPPYQYYPCSIVVKICVMSVICDKPLVATLLFFRLCEKYFLPHRNIEHIEITL